MTKPTREEVLERYRLIWDDLNSYEMTERLTFIRDAYLSQSEELARKNRLIKMQDGFIMEKSQVAADRLREIGRLEADNQALREQIVAMEVGIARKIEIYEAIVPREPNHD